MERVTVVIGLADQNSSIVHHAVTFKNLLNLFLQACMEQRTCAHRLGDGGVICAARVVGQLSFHAKHMSG